LGISALYSDGAAKMTEHCGSRLAGLPQNEGNAPKSFQQAGGAATPSQTNKNAGDGQATGLPPKGGYC